MEKRIRARKSSDFWLTLLVAKLENNGMTTFCVLNSFLITQPQLVKKYSFTLKIIITSLNKLALSLSFVVVTE